MNYYCTNTNVIELITTDFTKTNYSLVIADERNIPQENCEFLNGQLYDKTTPEYTKAKAIFDATEEYQTAINRGFVFDGNLYALDDASMNQYTMMKMLADLNQKEPIEVKDMYFNSVFMPAIKYVEFCTKIGERYKTILNTYADKVK